MKRLLCILLALTMFILPGCGETPRIKVSKLGDVRTDVYDVEWRMRIAGWSDLWYAYCAGVPYTITLPDSEAELAYDANTLTLTDENGTQTYQYLLSCPRQDKKGYTECLILSDDPEMTPEKCKTPEDGRIILQETMTFRLSPDQGEIPAFITSLESYGDVTFGKEVFYQLQEQDDSFTVNRYDYRGKLISKTEGLSCRGRILELEDGSFLYACDDYPSEYYALECYDQKGAHRWTYRFAEGRKPYVKDLQEHDGKLYCFSNARAPEGCDDWYLYMLSGEGECLQESRFGGSDFDRIDHVAKTEEGFTVYGTTQSRDGDFPFSSDGYGQDFVAGIDFALQLQNAQKADDSTSTKRIGYCRGQIIYQSIVRDPVPMQEVPEHVATASGVFDYEGGYVVKHVRSLGTWAMLDNPSFMSRTVTYTEVIYTGYSANGKPIWEYAYIAA